MMTNAKKGVYAAAITPLSSDGSPDLERLAGYCQRIIAEGLTGVAPAGTTGEGNSLPMAARLRMPFVFREAGLEPDRVIFGTGSCSVEDATEMTRACLDAGFPNVLVLPPFYFKSVPEDGLFAYYARLIEAVGDDVLRVYLYHFPQMSQTPIPVSLIGRLKSEFGPIIAGLKDSSGDYEVTLAFVRAAEDFDVFPSSEAFLCRALNDGCAGVISATTNAHPALAGRTLRSRSSEDQALLAEIREIISGFPLSAALKQIEAWKTGDESWKDVLPPLVPLTAQQSGTLRNLLQAMSEETAFSGVGDLPGLGA